MSLTEDEWTILKRIAIANKLGLMCNVNDDDLELQKRAKKSDPERYERLW